MLKLKLFLNALKKNYRLVLYFGVALILLHFYLGLRYQIREGLRREENLRENLLVQHRKDSLAIVTLATENKKLDGLYKSQTEYTLYWKTLYKDLTAVQDTVEGRIQVSFSKETKCGFISGYTLTDPPECPSIKDSLKPVKIKTNYLQVGNKVYSIITPENNCIQIKNVKSEIPSEYTQPYKKGFALKEFTWGAILTAAGFLLLN